MISYPREACRISALGWTLLLSVAGLASGETTISLPGEVPLVMVRVPSGTFEMGSPETERGRFFVEGPLHTVTIARDFYMGKYELTQQQWLAVMRDWPEFVPNPFYGEGDDYPAYFISWNDCQDFIAALNAHVVNTGQGPATFRLPSEAEWEYACRAGTQTRFFFGDSLSVGDDCQDGPAGTLTGNRTDYMWYCGNNGALNTPEYGAKPVGTSLPNLFGLHDMSGSLWEWCQDWSHFDYTGAPTDGRAWETPATIARMTRGGTWASVAAECRSAYRGGATPDYREGGIGVRLARTAPARTASRHTWILYGN